MLLIATLFLSLLFLKKWIFIIFNIITSEKKIRKEAKSENYFHGNKPSLVYYAC